MKKLADMDVGSRFITRITKREGRIISKDNWCVTVVLVSGDCSEYKDVHRGCYVDEVKE